ncbi:MULTISPECIES: aldehyde dehydrogenase family protein [Pseudomonas]|uniref:Aldehyde dehydrogenase family protein n=1 Tax=Pseudomonas juntendi TaxID=2666183 RepID=A0A7W2LV04_9PSED|nr:MULTISPECIES: aldehyde dehydrogenase family protein [Pseudomonas]QOH73061.1 aldehyde dehydrogenase family protein [Pseudomonas putida]MBA6133494.1 aldehyde dehydrogenase family protein [Pseudomonas juntendi]MBA6147571.1 aldehyde dehydrogenase family protein [Pseudomonas juntendi]MBH3385171.1 aldehyde dehydrogenase family protein [Pseudomonas juntendi]MCK2110457.1 aldehyde dehydrogenase family protein [Pseudomonas juntendi]
MTTSHYIAGRWFDGQGSDCISVNDPALGQPFAELMAASAEQVDQAVAAARAALPAWKCTSASERAAYLRGFAEQLGQRREALVALQMRNNGKPRHEAEVDLDDAIATFGYYAELAEQLPGQNRDVPLAAPGFTARTRLEPVGVVGLIVPWNFPLVTSAWKLAPALAAGCTVVLKPSEVTPLCELAYGQIADTLGLPAGVLNIVNGKAETGAALSNHNGLDKLSFTGSNNVGSQVMRSAAAQCRPVTLELGGKSAILVFDDCDVDAAVQWIVAGICWNAGQMCSATSRLLVQDGIADALLPRLQAALENLRVGSPLSEEADMGPLTSQAQWLKVAGYFATAREEGLQCLVGGKVLDRGGWFVSPTLYADVPEGSRLWNEEIFGPVLCARRFASEQQAIAEANDSRFGLVATVCTTDLARAERVADALEVGHVWINSVQAVFVETSWGGTKGSGIGRELGPWGLSGYQSVKHVTRCLG